MELKKIKEQLEEVIDKVNKKIEQFIVQAQGKIIKFPQGMLEQVISSRLKAILSNPIENPILTKQQMEDFYFGEKGLENTQKKYVDILELQDYIIAKTALPFILDKYIVLKMLSISLNDYNMILSDAISGTNARDEQICNIFLDIENLIVSDRNSSAENGTKNVKAVDMVNRYTRDYGGFGIRAINDKEKDNVKKEIYIVSGEEVEKKLANNFGFSKQLENKGKGK